MQTAKILQITEPGKTEIHEIKIPEPEHNEVLVKILAVATCPHWDLHLASGEPMFPGVPLTYPYTPGQPGHEAMGEVVSAGAGVPNLPVGTRVAAWKDQGHHRQGCYSQFACLDAENVLPIPEDTSPQSVVSLELAMCVQVSFNQLNQLGAVAGHRFAVGGLGPAGLIAVQMAGANGARTVVGIDPIESRRRLALQLGADEVYSPGDAEARAGVQEGLPATRFDSTSFTSAIDCTGLKASIEFLMDRTNDAVAIFGVLREDIIFRPRHYRSLALLGYRGHNRASAKQALELVLDGKVKLSPLITHTLPLTSYQDGVKLLRERKALKICYLPWESADL